MENFFAGLSAIATFAAAIAAWFSYKIASNSLTFQKQFARNQTISVQFNMILSILLKIKLGLSDGLNIPDSEFEELEPLFSELLKQLKLLNCQTQLSNELQIILNKKSVSELNNEIIDTSIKLIQKGIDKLWR